MESSLFFKWNNKRNNST